MDVDRFRVRRGDRGALARHKPDNTGLFTSKADAQVHLLKGLARLEERRQLLYAQDRYALLLVFQGMDGSGKDSVIRHVMSGVSPEGIDVHAFKQPSTEELDHDYLWRSAKVLPERGHIAGIFNQPSATKRCWWCACTSTRIGNT